MSRMPRGQEQSDDEKRFAELMLMSNFIDAGGSSDITLKEWMEAFTKVDVNKVGVITRKAWFLEHGSTDFFDQVPRHYLYRNHITPSSQRTRGEWAQAFKALDRDDDNKVSVKEWLKKAGIVPAPTPASAVQDSQAHVDPAQPTLSKSTRKKTNKAKNEAENEQFRQAVSTLKLFEQGPRDAKEHREEVENMFKFIKDQSGGAEPKGPADYITFQEWKAALDKLEGKKAGLITRKEWHLKRGSADTYKFEIPESYSYALRPDDEWERVFRVLDTDGDGLISRADIEAQVSPMEAPENDMREVLDMQVRGQKHVPKAKSAVAELVTALKAEGQGGWLRDDVGAGSGRGRSRIAKAARLQREREDEQPGGEPTDEEPEEEFLEEEEAPMAMWWQQMQMAAMMRMQVQMGAVAQMQQMQQMSQMQQMGMNPMMPMMPMQQFPMAPMMPMVPTAPSPTAAEKAEDRAGSTAARGTSKRFSHEHKIQTNSPAELRRGDAQSDSTEDLASSPRNSESAASGEPQEAQPEARALTLPPGLERMQPPPGLEGTIADRTREDAIGMRPEHDQRMTEDDTYGCDHKYGRRNSFGPKATRR